MPETMMEAPARKQNFLELMQTIAELAAMAADPEAADDERAVASAELERMCSIDLPRKVDGIAFFDKACDSEIALRKDMIRQMEADIARIDRAQEHVRAIAQMCVARTPDHKVRGDLFNLSVQPLTPRIRITDLGAVPLEFCRISTPALTTNTAAIRVTLEAGQEVPGAELLPAEETLYIRANARQKK